MLLPAAEEQKTANTAAWLPPQTNEDPLLKQPEDDVEEELSTASNSKAQDPVECTTHLRDRVRTHRQQAMMWFVLFVNMVVLIVVSVLMIVAIKKVQVRHRRGARVQVWRTACHNR